VSKVLDVVTVVFTVIVTVAVYLIVSLGMLALSVWVIVSVLQWMGVL